MHGPRSLLHWETPEDQQVGQRLAGRGNTGTRPCHAINLGKHQGRVEKAGVGHSCVKRNQGFRLTVSLEKLWADK